MKSSQVVVTNRLGLHARPSARLTQLATSFSSEVWLTGKGRRINAKSIMGVMMLAASMGSIVTVSAEGEDEKEALAAVVDLINRRFDEEE